MGHGSPHNSLFLLCKIERRGVIRVRIRCRVIRIRVRRACIRTIVRVTASGTHAKTYHAVRFRQLPNVAARCFCSFKIFARLRRGWGSHSRSHPPPPLWASMLFVSYDLAYFLGRGDCGVGLKIAERRGVTRARIRGRVIRIRARCACTRTIVRATASGTHAKTFRGIHIGVKIVGKTNGRTAAHLCGHTA